MWELHRERGDKTESENMDEFIVSTKAPCQKDKTAISSL